MAVQDLWYTTKVGPDGKPERAVRHGRGKRWRVAYTDAHGNETSRAFHRKEDAKDFDAKCRVGVADEVKVSRADRWVTFQEYAERWRLSREMGWATESRRRIPGNLRNHLYPTFGPLPIPTIVVTEVLEWILAQRDAGAAMSSVKLYFELFKTVMSAARADKIIIENPCDGVNISQIFRGVSRIPRWVPTSEEVLALFDVVPERFLAAVWLGAGQGQRLAETLGMENSVRCTDFLGRQLHTVQQLRYSRAEYAGYFLATPKLGSAGSWDLDPVVGDHLSAHIRDFPPVDVTLIDTTGDEPVSRTVALLFTDERGTPIHDRRWSAKWATWREAAGWPEHGTFHALRHYFATVLISLGYEPQDVQKALRHASLRVTLETYVHWWPNKERPKGVIGTVLGQTRARALTRRQQDQS